MTATGLVIIPVTLFLLFRDWHWLIVFLAIASGLLADSAVVNFSNFGVQPGYFILLCVIGRAGCEIIVRREKLRRDLLAEFTPMLVLIASSLIALLIASAFFEGSILVQTSRDGQDSAGSQFHFRIENYAQHAYVIVSTLGAICIAHKVSRMSIARAQRVAAHSLFGFTFVGAAIVAWQVVHYRTGLYFPDTAFFHNNVAYARSYGQNLFDFGYRLCGSFSEPSALGYYYSGCLLFCYRQYCLERNTVALVGTCTSLVLLLVSTSTSAYVISFLFCLWVAYRQSSTIGRLLAAGISGLRTRPVHIAILAALAVAAAIFVASNWRLVTVVVKVFIIDKPQTDSVSVRSAADMMALKIATETVGVGLGLGSHKANALPLTILSNAGVVGLAAFAWFMARCLRYPARPTFWGKAWPAVSPLQWCLAGLLFQHGFMNPNFNMATLWVVIGLLVGSASGRTTAPSREPAVDVPKFLEPRAVSGRWMDILPPPARGLRRLGEAEGSRA